MDNVYWQKQVAGTPLFPDLLWSRPEHRAAAGKLLIIGGNAFGFAAPGEAFAAATKAGAGELRVLLPDRLRSTVGAVLAAEYAPGNASGSFSSSALTEFMVESGWADSVLLAGDIGRNSETAILLEKFTDLYHGQLTITKDAVDYFTALPQALLARPETTLVLSFAQLQKLATNAHFFTRLHVQHGSGPAGRNAARIHQSVRRTHCRQAFADHAGCLRRPSQHY